MKLKMNSAKLGIIILVCINLCAGASFGEGCITPENCIDTGQSCADNSLCACDTANKYSYDGSKCVKELGADCTVNTDCNDAAITCETGTTGKVCKCAAGYYDSNGDGATGGACIARHSLDDSCTDPVSGAGDNQCSTANAACKAGSSTASYTCQCNYGYIKSGLECVQAAGNIGDPCSGPSACKVDNSECTGNSGAQTCTCSSGYYTVGNSCIKRQLGETCTNTHQCNKANTVCNGVCQCASDFYDTNGNSLGGNCNTKVTVGGTCPTPTQLVPNTATCSDRNARCRAFGNTYTCQCISTHFDTMYNTDRKCVLRKSLDAECYTPLLNIDQCSDPSALCRRSDTSSPYKCSCNPGYHKESTTCVANKPLGESCTGTTQEVECSDPAALCLGGKCTCDTSHYDNNGFSANGTCRPMSNLMVTNVAFSSIQTSQMTVRWSVPESFESHINGFTVKWKPKNVNTIDEESESLQSSARSLQLSRGIAPGRAYVVTIESKNDQTQQGSVRSISVVREQAAKPAMTGGIDTTRSDPDASDSSITVAWSVPAGYVSSYNVKLMDGDKVLGTLNPQSSSIVFSLSGLKNGYRYTVTIQANSELFDNGKTVEGDTYTSEFKTTPKAPTAPRSVSCAEIYDESINLSWQDPDRPNGDLEKYIVDVYDSQMTKQFTSDTNGVINSITIKPLKPGTWYTFKVYTRNELYKSTTSGDKTCQTRAKLSDPPSELHVTMVTSRNLTVTWNEPNNTYSEELYGYVIQILENNMCKNEIVYRCSDCKGIFQPSNLMNMCDISVRKVISRTKNQLGGKQTQQFVSLLPDTTYMIFATAVNNQGRGNVAKVTQTTYEEAPQTPSNVEVDGIGTTSFTVSWNISGPRPGKTNFTVTVTADSPAQSKELTVTGFSERSYKVENLEEYWNYSVSVKAATSVGTKTSQQTEKYRTLPAGSGKVSDFKIIDAPDGNYTQMQVTWKAPEILNRNSIIKEYRFIYSEIVQNNQITRLFQHEKLDTHKYIVTVGVRPEVTYTFQVYAVNDQNQEGEKMTENRQAPAGVPINIEVLLGEKIIPENKVTNKEQTQFTISFVLDFFEESTYGAIRAAGLMACAKDCDSSSVLQFKSIQPQR